MKRAILLFAAVAACKYAALPPLNGGDGGSGDGGGGDGPLPPGSPMLAAVEPAVAPPRTTIMLEGTFSDPMTVNFAGGVTANAIVLGPHRASVIVPVNAGSGPLNATTGGVTTASVPFRVTSFLPGLANFHTNFEQVDAARMPPTLAAARAGATAAVVGHNLYVIGGGNAGTNLNTVERALINADGTLGTFTLVSGVTLVTARSKAISAVIAGYVYVIGGTGAGGPLATVERAQIQSDGSLGTFAMVSGVALATARADATSAIVGDSIYVLGGTGASGKLPSIESAVIDPDGSLEAFATSTQALSTARTGASALAAGGFLYVLGGDTASGVTASVEDAPIAGDGTLGTFAGTPGVGLTSPRVYFSMAVVGTTAFVIGGTGPVDVDIGTTESASIGTDGTLGSFAVAAGGGLTIARHYAATAVARDHVFLLGGNNGTTEIASVERSGIATGGGLASFGTLGAVPLGGPRAEARSVVLGDHVYLIGGADLSTFTPRTDVDMATVQPDGSLGSFALVSGVTSTTTRIGPALAVIGNYLYVIGGQDTTMSYTGYTSIERAAISADGTLGTFQLYSTATLTTGRYFAAAAIVGTTLYVMGGIGGTTQALSSTEQAAVDTSGSLSFFFSSSSHLVVPHSNYGSAVLGGYCYVFGGTDTAGVSTKVFERAPIQTDGSLGAFAYELDTNGNQMFMATERALYTPSVVGDDLYLVTGANNVGSPSDPGLRNLDHATIAANGTLSAFAIASGPALAEGIFYHSGATAGNYIYVLGGGSHTSTTTPSEVKQALLQ
jgi:N-acetylneuraminic acid mutarotase